MLGMIRASWVPGHLKRQEIVPPKESHSSEVRKCPARSEHSVLGSRARQDSEELAFAWLWWNWLVHSLLWSRRTPRIIEVI